jgi:hypothetical protein
MKNFKLLLAAAMMIAVGSSFAASGNNAVAGEYVKNSNGTYELKGNGLCQDQPTSTCDYTIIDPMGPLDEDSNFQPHAQGLWVRQ